MGGLLEKVTRLTDWLEGWAGAIGIPCVIYLASRVVLAWASEQHWVLGAIVSVPLAALAGLLFVCLNDYFFRKFPTRVIVSLFASVVLLAASICSAWSYILLSKGWAAYTSPKELHPGVFADFYLWHVIDMIPGLNVWETLGIQAPVKANDPVANIPVLIFRVCVVLPVFALVKKWYDAAKEGGKTGNDS